MKGRCKLDTNSANPPTPEEEALELARDLSETIMREQMPCSSMERAMRVCAEHVAAALAAERDRALEDAATLVEWAQHMPPGWNLLSLPGHIRALKDRK